VPWLNPSPPGCAMALAELAAKNLLNTGVARRLGTLPIPGWAEQTRANVPSSIETTVCDWQTGPGILETIAPSFWQNILQKQRQNPLLQPPAMAPTTRNGSVPVRTASGNFVSGGSSERSSPHAKNLMNGRRRKVIWSRIVPRNTG
jgi:hypothetical protein